MLRFALLLAGALVVVSCGSPAAPPAKTAEAKDPQARALAGVNLLLGKEGMPDEKRALAIFERLCDEKFAGGCVLAGIVLFNGKGVARNEARAIDLFRTACDAGDRIGCQLASVPVPPDRPITARDVEYATALCDLGTAVACMVAGNELVEGKVVPRNEPAGMKMIEKSCDDGYLTGCGMLGALLVESPRDEEARGLALLERTCDKGHGLSCMVLASAHAHGTKTLPADVAAAVPYEKRACDAGNVDGCSHYGTALGLGKGIAKDATRGMSVLEPLCRDAHADSCARLGVIQFQEHLTDAARKSLERSCSLESELGCRALDATFPGRKRP